MQLNWNLFYLICLALSVVVFYVILAPKNDEPVCPKNLIVISFDGFRYDYISKGRTPNLYRLAVQHGVTGHMLSTFSTKTFPNHQSIATGLYQETHGIVHNSMFDPNFGEPFKDKEDGKSDRWWDNNVSVPIYIANQLFDSTRSSCCSPWIGCHVRYFGKYRARYHRYYNKSSMWQEQFEWSMKRLLSPEYPANLVMIYIDQPDMNGHIEGPFGTGTLEQVRQIDRFVLYVERRLHQLNLVHNTNLIFLSDHGLSEISSKRILVLDSFLNQTWYDAYGCNPVFHIQPRAGFEEVVEKELRLKAQSVPFQVFTKEEIPPRLHYRSNRRIHDLLVVADEGWSIHKDLAQAQNQFNHKGQHGYDNLAESMRPLFIATGPSFKSAYYHRTKFTNVDLYPMMLKLLGIEANYYYNQGNYSRVRQLLKVEYQ